MENCKIKGRYLKFCCGFRAVIRYIKAAFYRADYQKLLICPLVKRLGQAFVSKPVAEPLKHSSELLKHSVEFLKHSAELLRV